MTMQGNDGLEYLTVEETARCKKVGERFGMVTGIGGVGFLFEQFVTPMLIQLETKGSYQPSTVQEAVLAGVILYAGYNIFMALRDFDIEHMRLYRLGRTTTPAPQDHHVPSNQIATRPSENLDLDDLDVEI